MKLVCWLIVLQVFLGTNVWALDFAIKGQWNMGFGLGTTKFVNKTRNGAGQEKKDHEDKFVARQRLLLQLDATASENLSGTVMFHIGPQAWGFANQGGALGADGVFVKVRQAYIDWLVPNTSIKTRMGIQNFALPYAAGGSAIFDLRAAAVNTHIDLTDNVGLTALWFRPFNDNYPGGKIYGSQDSSSHYLDNMDLFSLILPIHFDGFEITPWALYGIQGRNTGKFDDYRNTNFVDGGPAITMTPYLNYMGGGGGLNVIREGKTSKDYGSLFFAGLPIKVSALDPWNIEFDFNYGYVEELGEFEAIARNNPFDRHKGSTQRQGWLVKAMVEYKMDWGVPGIFGWYGSGDDGDLNNGSERLPAICPYTWFTSFMGDGNLAWAPRGDFQDLNTSMSGTWGIGLQLADMSFLEHLKHTFRVAWWGGTNSPDMVKYMDGASAWNSTSNLFDGPYMTTNDGLLEFNLVNVYQVYENFNINLELGYIANYMDDDTWKKSYAGWGSYEKQDLWKAQVIFTYSF
ncbi:MAG: outer membrane homotrimeric porin [Desulfovibrionaceae bacterium]|nr:outer membrane homotrimeric porin [Desulfovibrionaceae bacterium]